MTQLLGRLCMTLAMQAEQRGVEMGKRERRQLPFCLGDEWISAADWEKGGACGGGSKIEYDMVQWQPVMGWRGRIRNWQGQGNVSAVGIGARARTHNALLCSWASGQIRATVDQAALCSGLGPVNLFQYSKYFPIAFK
jgi:hypothetical protein